MKVLYDEHGMVLEPTGVVSVAGIIKHHQNVKGPMIGILCGQNVDRDQFDEWVS